MPKVELTRGDWETVVLIMEVARDQGIVNYIDWLITDIKDQVYAQEY